MPPTSKRPYFASSISNFARCVSSFLSDSILVDGRDLLDTGSKAALWLSIVLQALVFSSDPKEGIAPIKRRPRYCDVQDLARSALAASASISISYSLCCPIHRLQAT
jgi:hypothetical protein